MTDRLALIAQLAWQAREVAFDADGVPMVPDEEYVRQAIKFVEMVEKLTRPEPSKCKSLYIRQDCNGQSVCELSLGHNGPHACGAPGERAVVWP